MVYNLVYTLLSTPAGLLADKLGAHYVFPLGLVIYILVYVGFAFNTHPQLVWILFAIYGAYIALTDGVAKALIGAWITPAEAGAAYGVKAIPQSFLIDPKGRIIAKNLRGEALAAKLAEVLK